MQTIDEFKQLRNWIVSTPTDQLAKNQAGNLVFPNTTDAINELKWILSLAGDEAIGRLPSFVHQELIKVGGPAMDRVKGIRDIKKDFGQADAQQVAPIERWFSRHTNSEDSWFGYRPRLFAVLQTAMLLDHARIHANEAHTGSISEIASILRTAREQKIALDGIIASAQKELSETGVEKHRSIFFGEAGDRGREANTWRRWSLILFGVDAVILLVILGLILWGGAVLSTSDKIEIGVFGAGLISLVSFGVAFCVRNYFAARHNEVLNRHKANCLGSFETFSNSADQQAKAAVLLQATQTIFSHQRTGYLSKEAEMGSPSVVAEFLRRMPSSAE